MYRESAYGENIKTPASVDHVRCHSGYLKSRSNPSHNHPLSHYPGWGMDGGRDVGAYLRHGVGQAGAGKSGWGW